MTFNQNMCNSIVIQIVSALLLIADHIVVFFFQCAYLYQSLFRHLYFAIFETCNCWHMLVMYFL